MASPITDMEEVPEGTTPVLGGTFRDENGTAIPVASLATATLTISPEEAPGVVINGRSAFNLLPYINSSGVLSFPMDADDTKHVTTQTREYHRAIIRWTWVNGTTRAGVSILRYPIVDIAQV